jgi:hypothetical protein
MRQCGYSSVQCFLHCSNQKRWKRSVGKILHFVPSEPKFQVNRGFIQTAAVIAESRLRSTYSSIALSNLNRVPPRAGAFQIAGFGPMSV